MLSEDMMPTRTDPAPIPMEQELQARLAWFIGLRWIAGFTILIATILVKVTLLPNLPTAPLWVIGWAILGYNLLFRWYLRRTDRLISRPTWFIVSQIGLDWIALLLVMFFSGGIRSPVAIVLVFHIIIGAMLLYRRACYQLTGLAILLLGILAIGEETGLIVPPPIWDAGVNHLSIISTGSIWFGLSTFLIITAYLATSISTQLREREKALFESERTLHRAYHDMEALYQIGQVVNSTLDLDEILGLIAENATRLLNMKACFIRLLDKSKANLSIGGSYGLSEAYQKKGPIEVRRSLVDFEALKGDVIQVLEVGEDTRFQYREEARKEGLHSMLCVRLQSKSGVLGVIRVYSGVPHVFSEPEQNLLRNLANLGAIAIENAHTYKECSNLNKEKVWFAQMTNHQLRSPLTAIQGVIDALPYAGPLNEKQTELIERAGRRIQDAFDNVRDILDLSAAQRARAPEKSDPVSISAALHKVIDTSRESAQIKGITFDAAIPPDISLKADADDLELIFSNLLGNALKYTPRGGRIEFRVSRSDFGVTAVVSDNGIGIAPENHEQIFTSFFRTKEAKLSGEIGSGLGLTIVKTLVDRLGGYISLESQPDRGASFTVTFPDFK
ncbi:GAF domain-containing sensor histidine kinase [bacterium]|nr:GAF domain-containing sensor histidine kinase [bacterium]